MSNRVKTGIVMVDWLVYWNTIHSSDFQHSRLIERWIKSRDGGKTVSTLYF